MRCSPSTSPIPILPFRHSTTISSRVLIGTAGSKRFPNIFTIPLDRIPTISSLTVSTCTQLLFTCASDGAIAMNSYRMPCSLREVRFVGCRDMQIGDFQSAVQSLKDAEIWDSIELVVVEGSYYLDYNGVLDVIGKERLCYLT